MQAVVITRPGGPEVLEIRDVPVAEPVADWVRVRVHAAGLNRADLAQRAGYYPAPPGSPSDIPGLEFAGEVEAVGPLVRSWQPGQRVMGIAGGGAQAEYILAHEGMLVEIPERLDFVQAAALPEAFMTAHDALFTQAGLQVGERLLIHAIGSGVGIAALQIAKAAGATVFGTSRSSDKLERARALGLDAGYSGDDFAAEILRLTHDQGVNVVLDFVGSPYFEQSCAALAMWGRLVFLASLGGAKAQLDIPTIMRKGLQIRGSMLRSRTLGEKIQVTRRFEAHVVPLLASGEIVPLIDEVIPMRDIVRAHVMIQENKNFGKIVLRIV